MKPLGISKLGFKTHHRAVGTVVAVGTGLSVCAWRASPGTRQDDSIKQIVKLPAPIVDALAGALGEVAQILVLYPLDTVKVRCQSTGEPAAVVLRRLLRRGVNLQLLQKLYAGALGAAACAVLVGAVHFASYEASRKAALRILSSRTPAPSANSGSDNHAAIIMPGESLAAGAILPANSVGNADSSTGRMVATFAAAAVAAVATALVESPVELFRHNAQAGLVQPNFMREMAATVRREGVGGLYWGFLPHCFEAWPHDISELATYGFMRELQESTLRPGSRHHGWMSNMSEQAWDLATGAASGAAAVVVSMPFDTVKTYLQTHGADFSGRGLLGSAALFMKSARRIVARKGPAGLYVGVTPRLLQQVPSAMVCWWTIAAFKRAMEAHTQSEELMAPNGSSGQSSTGVCGGAKPGEAIT